ncbi:MAG: hypothetical protein L6R30_03230 [Thermoanaerobaculia bacterium]|nr:hypothetical protein [Thermoanaerobaculia bacterium]
MTQRLGPDPPPLSSLYRRIAPLAGFWRSAGRAMRERRHVMDSANPGGRE